MSSKSLPASLVCGQPIRGPCLLSSQQLQPRGPGAHPPRGPVRPRGSVPAASVSASGRQGNRAGGSHLAAPPAGDARVRPPGEPRSTKLGCRSRSMPETQSGRARRPRRPPAPARPSPVPPMPAAPGDWARHSGPLGHHAWPLPPPLKPSTPVTHPEPPPMAPTHSGHLRGGVPVSGAVRGAALGPRTQTTPGRAEDVSPAPRPASHTVLSTASAGGPAPPPSGA